jgi:hypothetical protein
VWFLDRDGSRQWDGCGLDRCVGFVVPGLQAVAGDWAKTGQTKMGLFRDGVWLLDLNGNGQWDGCSVDACASFGLAGDEGVVGNW